MRGIKEERRGESFLVLRGTCAKSFERFAGKRKRDIRDREEKRDVEGGGRIGRAQLKSIIGYLLGGEAMAELHAARCASRGVGGTRNPSICRDTIITVPRCTCRDTQETNGRARVHAFARQKGHKRGRKRKAQKRTGRSFCSVRDRGNDDNDVVGKLANAISLPLSRARFRLHENSRIFKIYRFIGGDLSSGRVRKG